MMKNLILAAMLTSASGVAAQERNHPQWAVGLHLGTSQLAQPQHVPYHGEVSYGASEEKCLGALLGLSVEYNFKDSPFSLRGALETDLLDDDDEDYCNADILGVIAVGARYRPAPTRWLLYPYAGLDLVYNAGGRDNINRSGICDGVPFVDSGYYKFARLGAQPVLGCELYVNPRIATFIECGYIAGFGGKARYTTEYAGNTYTRRGRMDRWHFTLGLKFTTSNHRHKPLRDLF